MARRRKTVAKEKNTGNEIKGIILITLGILMIISVMFSSSSGILGSLTRKILISFFGFAAYVIPILIIMTGYCVIANKNSITLGRKFYGILLLVINTSLCVQMIVFDKYYDSNSVFSGIEKIYSSDTVFHGGILSFILDIPLYKLLGKTNSFVIFTAIYVVAIILLFKLSLYDVLSYLKFKRKEKVSYEEEKEEKIKELPLEETEKNQYVKSISNRIKIMDFMKSMDENKEEIKVIDSNINNTNNKPNSESEVASDSQINEELEKSISNSTNKIEYEYQFPEVELLKSNSSSKLNKEDKKELINNANKLEETLGSFGVEAKVLQVSKGPSVTRFELQPSPGVKVSKIVNLSDDIALGLAAKGVRIEAPIPNKSAIGIEVPNRELTPVFLREVIESPEFINSKKNIAFSLGKDISGNCVVADLSKMPHLLIAGATGSGKSVCINTLIISILYKYSPEDVKLLMVDPKVVELNIYNGIPHLLIPVVTDPKKAAGALFWAVSEMTKRYKLFADNNVRNIEGYNELYENGKVDSKLPFIVIIIDELADLMMVCPNDIEDYIGRLAQMARAAGMHLVIATQRPSVDVITGVIKANIPSRISFAVSSQIDSRTILDSAGAEKLLGKGDMLFYPVGEGKPIRIQGAFISEGEVETVVGYIKNQGKEPDYKEDIINQIDAAGKESSGDEDELLEEAIRIVVDSGQASTSLIQRRLRIGYNRAARIMEQLEANGVISGRDGSKPRQILIEKNEL